MSIVTIDNTAVCTTCNTGMYVHSINEELFCSKCSQPAHTPTHGLPNKPNHYNMSEEDFINYTKDLENMYLEEYNEWVDRMEERYS